MVKNIFILDEHLKTDRVLTVNGKNAFFDDSYTLDLSTGTETYEFSTTITGIDESNYVMFYYHGKYKLFQIVEIEQEHAEGEIITTVYAETACLELLNNVVRSFEGEFNAISFLNHVLEGTGWSIGEYSSSLAEKVVSVKVDKTTQKWACIQDYMGNFGYEISPYVIYNNGHVKSKMIDVYSEGELGERTYKRFEYGYNVTGMVKKKDLYDWCTALIIDTDKDITNITCNGNGYVKAANSDVILATNENRKYNLGREYIYSNFDANGCNDGTEAVAKALEELKRRATPRFDYECTTALTYEEYELLNLGDTVYCIDNSFNPPVTLEARVGKLELSFTDRTKCRCTLTNYKEVKSKNNMELTGNIQEIIDSYFPITSDNIANGAITDGKIDDTYYEQITTDIVNANKVVTEELIAKKIMAVDAKFDNLETIYAKIENLNATNANITNLTSEVANIRTLINGNLTSDNIQSLVLTADKVTIANALIKDAHIESVNASKVNTGILNTNNVSIQSDDGSMLLQGNLQQFKDKNGNVRIQIGKDATGNFTFSLFDANGTGVLIDEKGIKSGAVANGLIVDAMVNDNANISGGKLDIDSVVTEINGSTNTIKSSKIYLDKNAQTLDVAFNTLSTTVENLKVASGDVGDLVEKVTTNTTNIGIAQGQISSLISNTTITKQDGTVTQLKDEYMSTQQTVNGLTTKVGSLETNYKATLKSSSPQYYVSTSSTSLSGGSWSDSSPTWTAGKYIWQRMKYTYTDNTVKYSAAVCIQGAKGEQGDQGLQGIQGERGEQGIPGSNGKTTYFHIKYSANANGNPMTETPSEYIGTYVDYIETDSTDYRKYTWARFQGLQGQKGEQGIPGTNGNDGQTYYLHIKYSNDGGRTFTSNNGETPGDYIGIYTDTIQADSTNVSKYTWSKIKGEQGLQGLQGPKGDQGIQGPAGNNGADGKTTYFHIKYSSVAKPTSSSQMTETPSEYIGTYVDYTAADSTDPNKYTWARFQGLQGAKGDQGIPGTNGTNGQTYYLHIKYSNDGGGTFTSNNGETPGEYIGVYTDTTQADSTSVSKYTWSKVKGETGEKGQSLVKSTPQWYLSTSKTTQTGGSWVETMPSVTTGKYMWLRYKLDWQNPTATTYTTPTLEQTTESVKEVISKQATLEQNLDGFKTTVSKTYATQSSVNSSISSVEQTANKIEWLIKSGTSKSDMMLTDELFNLVSNNITLTADHINLEGFVTANQNFRINENGTITARGADIVGALTSTRNIVLYTNDRAFRGIDTQGTECTLAHIDDVNCCRFGWGSWIGNSSLAYDQGSEFMGGKKAVLRSQENTYLVCNGMTYNSTGGGSLVFLNNSSGDYIFRPVATNKNYLGSGSYRWIKLYTTSAADVSSDRELKENIKYLQNDNLNTSAYTIENDTEITYDNMYKFIRDDLSLAQYNYKDVNSSEIGFIAQDLLVNTDGSDNTIGQLIIDPKCAVKDSIENGEKSYLSYNTGSYTHVIAGALKRAIMKIDKLEKKINDLEESIYQK